MNTATGLTVPLLATQSDASSLIPAVDAAYIRTEGLDRCLSSLLRNLQNMQVGDLKQQDDCGSLERAQPESPVSTEILNLMRIILCFDPVEAASKIRSISDGQGYVDFMLQVSNA